jgi:hypothetical protein
MHSFNNKWYPLLLTSVLCFVIITRAKDLLFEWNWVSVIHLAISLLVAISIMFKVQVVGIMVKFWAGLSILGGGLGLISVLVLLNVGAVERIEVSKVITHISHLIIGYILFHFWNKSVEIEEDLDDYEEILDA